MANTGRQIIDTTSTKVEVKTCFKAVENATSEAFVGVRGYARPPRNRLTKFRVFALERCKRRHPLAPYSRLSPYRRGRTALFNWLYARRKAGNPLRIEDTDKARSTQAAIDALSKA